MSLRKILMVEDDMDIQLVARLGLQKLGGFEVRIANNGQEAFEQLKTWQPDLILMDVMMPVMDGLQTLKALKADPILKLIPVVFVTARSAEAELQELRNLGAVEVLSKPFDPTKLPAKIKEIWAKL